MPRLRYGASLTKGTKKPSGKFVYGIYDVEYYSPEAGVIVYTTEVNAERDAIAKTLTLIGLGSIIGFVVPELLPYIEQYLDQLPAGYVY